MLPNFSANFHSVQLQFNKVLKAWSKHAWNDNGITRFFINQWALMISIINILFLFCLFNFIYFTFKFVCVLKCVFDVEMVCNTTHISSVLHCYSHYNRWHTLIILIHRLVKFNWNNFYFSIVIVPNTLSLHVSTVQNSVTFIWVLKNMLLWCSII